MYSRALGLVQPAGQENACCVGSEGGCGAWSRLLLSAEGSEELVTRARLQVME